MVGSCLFSWLFLCLSGVCVLFCFFSIHYAKRPLHRNKALWGPLPDGREVSMEIWEDAADFCCQPLGRTGLAGEAQLLPVVVLKGGK